MSIQGGYILQQIWNFEPFGNTERYLSKCLQNLNTVEQTTFELQIRDIGLTNLGKI